MVKTLILDLVPVRAANYHESTKRTEMQQLEMKIPSRPFFGGEGI
jgi:hypothetical protein